VGRGHRYPAPGEKGGAADYAFLSLVPGDDLHTLQADLPAPEVAAVRMEVAALAARLHTVTGPAYGYPLRGSRSWQRTWRGAFGAMVTTSWPPPGGWASHCPRHLSGSAS
jgi:hypothetical protein